MGFGDLILRVNHRKEQDTKIVEDRAINGGRQKAPDVASHQQSKEMPPAQSPVPSHNISVQALTLLSASVRPSRNPRRWMFSSGHLCNQDWYPQQQNGYEA
jgi:hypothetical protein